MELLVTRIMCLCIYGVGLIGFWKVKLGWCVIDINLSHLSYISWGYVKNMIIIYLRSALERTWVSESFCHFWMNLFQSVQFTIHCFFSDRILEVYAWSINMWCLRFSTQWHFQSSVHITHTATTMLPTNVMSFMKKVSCRKIINSNIRKL